MTDVKKFRARFYRKFGERVNAVDMEQKDVLIPYDRLTETKLKPPSTFVFQRIDYIFVKEAIRSYDKDGRPIIKYFLGNAMPIMEDSLVEPTVLSPEEKKKALELLEKNLPVDEKKDKTLIEELKNGLKILKGIVINSEAFDKVFNRGEMKGIIASSQKEPQKLDLITILIGGLMGGAMGVVIGIFIQPYVFPHAAVTTVTKMIQAGLRI